SAFSCLYLIVLAMFYTQDSIDRQTLVEACAIVATLVVAFFVAFRVDLNLYVPDASLTGWQFLASVLTMLYVDYRAPDTRLVFPAFYFVALMCCILRHSGRALALLSAVSLVSFALVIWLRYAMNANEAVLRS